MAVLVFKGNGRAGFAPSSLPCRIRPAARRRTVAVGDIDGDGVGDVAVANMEGNNVTVLLGSRRGLRPAPASPIAVGGGPLAIAVADVDGDGKADVVTGNLESGDVSVVFSRQLAVP
jgi:hypothetical protein